MTSHLTEHQRTALTVATERAAALHARVVTGRAGSDDQGASQAVIGEALAAAAQLVDAVPALADRHQAWMVRFAATEGQPVGRRVLAAVNHVSLLARAGRRPVVIADPGGRFAGDLDEIVVTHRGTGTRS